MLDLLSAMGTIEILQFIKENPKNKSNEINKVLTEQNNSSLTTATIYRRLKELELAGFIKRDPPSSKFLFLTPEGEEVLTKHVQKPPEIVRMKRSHRALLHEIDQQEGINVVQLQTTGLSPTTINKRIQDLAGMGLVKQYSNNAEIIEKEQQPKKKAFLKRGRPKIRHKLTKKGKRIAEEQKQIEEK
ncbi:MAG: hypothetical protein ACXACU_12575 [Candidatus Hodarchaeales archaeon]|jgi:DNA-binding MarR family transcriptional regulator